MSSPIPGQCDCSNSPMAKCTNNLPLHQGSMQNPPRQSNNFFTWLNPNANNSFHPWFVALCLFSQCRPLPTILLASKKLLPSNIPLIDASASYESRFSLSFSSHPLFLFLNPTTTARTPTVSIGSLILVFQVHVTASSWPSFPERANNRERATHTSSQPKQGRTLF